MGQTIQLTAADGHKLSAYRADPAGAVKGGIVVIQEIFGVNGHIRRVTDGYAADGYVAIAPALFDRVKPGIELGYQEADIASGREVRMKVSVEQALADIDAAKKAIAGPLSAQGGKLGVVGYCWGGTLTWLSATRLDGFSAAAGYYGGGIGNVAEEKPRCPVQMHFGETDHAIPLAEVAKLRAAQGANVEIQIYPAGHGFNCDERGSYHKPSADRARARVLAFFKEYVG
jgi:carboxymethylenebutenolidase